ncbi:ABC transporter substrate-binding protein [Nitrogeniibacter mangrovi]|uniref:ABC transporter substrate-binding protein n=1 Tax=Nitrogeniibacter mangrovi TaxID=2016596 RepID=A0A6C1B350_9RHOO|nr:ABC transporter substrate-binding protein [Nitrogeniibacter mangrovi]QID17813.1 ABC transporter substrate-binding protein [Nitrogeniibacter mangrovi]
MRSVHRLLARVVICLVVPALLAACGRAWNDPYPAAEAGKNILYAAFTAKPKHLDPVQSYTEDEATFLYQIYEPPLQYHYLKRPYTLIPGSAARMPRVTRYDRAGAVLPDDAPNSAVDHTVFEIEIRHGVRYQPHPAFALRPDGAPAYVPMPAAVLEKVNTMGDFPLTGTRELVADDFIYQLKRLASPQLHSPILELMSGYIPGLKRLHEQLVAAAKGLPEDAWLDLDEFTLDGVERVDRYTYRIRVKGAYPQLLYWMSMQFFAPVPREVDRFFHQPGMAAKNLTLDWWPVGTGPYMLVENDPNARMVLARNPNYRHETYPCQGEPEDGPAGLLADCGKPIPFLDEAVFTREKESIPYWTKFLQGYYDASGVSSDNFDQAVQISGEGEVSLSDEMRDKGIELVTSVSPSLFYMGFNMLDGVVGGDSERARKLRLAVSIVIDQEEFISVFLNGRGTPGMGPIPTGIYGSEEGEAGINPFVYDWKDGHAVRKPVAEARQLLAEAGYPNGRDAKTGEPLVLYLDTTTGGMGDKAYSDWLIKQFHKIDVQLVVRATDWNRFQDKLRKGSAQLFFLGWNADYPDPENFFFLLHGPQSRVTSQGENAANYRNPRFDALFEKMKTMRNGPERLAIIREMNHIVQHDAPWIFAYYPKAYVLQHGWMKNRKPGKIIRNTLKYQRVDPALRARERAEWNQPVLWPLGLLALVGAAIVLPALRRYRAHERTTAATHETGRG